jgi:mersacidin/lichenicidin family type 2 lantibiotic
MSEIDVARAWRDPKYRRSLTEEQRAALPENPAGLVELSDDDLRVAGGSFPIVTTALTCTMATFLGLGGCACVPITTAPICTIFTFRKWVGCGCP